MEQIENPEGDPHKYSTDFYSGAESNSVEERQPFPQVMLEQRTFTCRKKKKKRLNMSYTLHKNGLPLWLRW